MKRSYASLILWPASFFALIAYLAINTGIVSDDIIFTTVLKNKNMLELISPRLCLQTPAESIFFYIWYPFFSFDNPIFVNTIKISYIFLSFYMISRFFGIYLERVNAFMASFIFIFFPSHDATVYWFLGQYLMLSMAFYLYAYYLAYHDRPIPAVLMAVAASFISYGSPAIAIALFCMFAVNKKFKKGLLLLIPNLLYIFYYITVACIMPGVNNRIPHAFNIFTAAKQFVFQALTFIDSTLGPSMWLKIYYSVLQLSVVSIIVGIMAVLILYKFYRPVKERYDRTAMIGLGVLTVSSFAMFALTGAYPQMAFNLGNRVTIFGSLALAYLFIVMGLPRMPKILLFAVMLFSILGISDHWKAWDLNQQRVMANIVRNKDLKDIKGDIYVSGNQYSRLGPLSHIEFLSEDQVSSVFERLVGKAVSAKSLNKRFKYENGYLVDTKYGERDRVGSHIYVYDSENDKVLKIKAGDINKYIKSLPADNRHWVQIVGNKRINDLVLRFMPRLKYAF